MSTITKPRPRTRNGSSAKPDVSTPVERFDKARTFIATTKRRASRIASDKAGIPNPSTRSRTVMKAKADAFEQIDAILAGRDAD